MEKTRKFYVCHANDCKFNSEGSCNKDLDCVIIAVCDGVAQCPNYEQACVLDDNKAALAKGLLDEIKAIYADMYDGADLAADMEVDDLTKCELCTDKDGNCFVIAEGSTYMQDFVNDERVACLVDAYNTVIAGKPSIATFQE